MKALRLLSFLFALSLFGCHDSDTSNYPVPSNTIRGEWKLVNVSGGIAGTNDTFPEGSITWRFNANQTVTVTNTNTDENKVDILESNTYPYALISNDATPELCSVTIRIGDYDLGCYSISSNTFTISQVETDGYLIRLIR